MANRQLQVGEMIKRALSEIIRDTVFDSVLEGVSVIVSEVRISPDLKSCTVHVLPMTGGRLSSADLLAALHHHSGRIRILLCKKIVLRYAPELTFKVDASFDEASRIGKLINT